MSPIAPGDPAPALDVPLDASPSLLAFYKVTCPVCQLAAPVVDRLARAFPGRVVPIGQDPPEALREFGATWGMADVGRTDPPPYAASDAFGVRAVPTLVLVAGGRVADVVEGWDRAGWNRIADRLAESSGLGPVVASDERDGLPSFRPG